jgi:hypothetical protein
MGLEDLKAEMMEKYEASKSEEPKEEPNEEPKQPKEEPEGDAWYSRFGYEDENKFVEDFENYKSSATKVSEYEQQLNEYKAKQEELNSQLKNTSLVQDEDLQRLAYLKNTDENAYDFHLKRISGATSAMDIQKMKYAEEYGDLSDIDSEFIEKQILNKFGIKKVDLDDLDDDERSVYEKEIKMKQRLLEKDAEKYLKSKEDEFKQIKTYASPELSDEQIALRREQAKQSWNGKVDPLLSSLSKNSFSVVLDKESGETFDFDFELTPDDRKAYSEKLNEIIYNNGINYSDEVIDEINKHVKQQIVIDKYQSMIEGAVTKAIEDRDAYWSEKLNNPSGHKTPSRPMSSDAKKYQQLFEERLNQRNKKRKI